MIKPVFGLLAILALLACGGSSAPSAEAERAGRPEPPDTSPGRVDSPHGADGAARAPAGGQTRTEAQAAEDFRRVESPTPERVQKANAITAKSVLDLQLWRREKVLERPSGRITWTDLAPQVGAWHLLTFDGGPSFHLQLAHPGRWRLALEESGSLTLESTAGQRVACELFGGDSLQGGLESLAAAAASGRAFTPICDGRLHVRARTEGRKSSLESTTDFLRDNIWGGEELTVWVRSTVFKDRHLQTAPLQSAPAVRRGRVEGAPAPARSMPGFAGLRLAPGDFGLELADRTPDGLLTVSRWLAVEGLEGAYATVTQARLFDVEVGAALDEVEASALVYLVAFDLERFDLGFALGTEHPRVGWSERVPPSTRLAELPGPDGFDEVAPLRRTGRVPPDAVARLVATFTGGFKRSHGAFKWGERATSRFGHHYGFIEEGVVLSRLVPGLSTIVVRTDGRVDLLTWGEEQDALPGDVRFARQNGVPLVELGDDGRPRPGRLIHRWSEGNWSGSQDQKLRSVRAGACLQESKHGRFLIYGYFSSATPAAMARVFLGYDCRHALLLDMNALEHTYLALTRGESPDWRAEHLVRGMEEVDPVVDGVARPRFLARADNRDFFYLTHKSRQEEGR